MGQVEKQYIEQNFDRDEVVVYIILTHYNTYYTGITNNLIRRYKEHLDLKSSYLSKYRAKEVIHIEWFKTRKEAARKERYIKKVGANNYLLRLRYKTTFAKFNQLISL